MVGTAKLINSTCTRRDVEVREYVSNYQITDVVSTAGEGPVSIILFAAGLPSLGDYYGLDPLMSDGDTFAVATGFSNIQPLDWKSDRQTWTCSVKYSTDSNKQRRPATNHDNPLDKPPIISFRGHRRQRPADFRDDWLGNPVRNSAGWLFDPNDIMVDVPNWALRITINQATVDPGIIDYYTNGVNVTDWMNGAAKTWKLEPPEARLVYWGNTSYWEVTYEFLHNPDTWQLKPPDKSILDKNLNLPASTRGVATFGTYEPLDGSGEFIDTVGAPLVYFDGEAGNPGPIEWYPLVDFTQLGLPSSLP